MSFISLAEISGAVSPVEIRGQKLQVRGLRLSEIAALLAKYPSLVGPVADANIGALVKGIFESGHDAVCHVIDLSCSAPAGTAEEALLSATDELEILTCCVSATLPESEDRTKKFWAELQSILDRFGLKPEDLMKKWDGVMSSSNSSSGGTQTPSNTPPAKQRPSTKSAKSG